jgi:hypothetical protein
MSTRKKRQINVAGEPVSLTIETDANISPRKFVFTPLKDGVVLRGTREDHMGMIHSVTGHIDREDMIELVVFLMSITLGITDDSLVQSTDENKVDRGTK